MKHVVYNKRLLISFLANISKNYKFRLVKAQSAGYETGGSAKKEGKKKKKKKEWLTVIRSWKNILTKKNSLRRDSILIKIKVLCIKKKCNIEILCVAIF